MKIIVGLGNPGDKYQHTRHNVGFMAIEELAKKLNLQFKYEKKFNAEVAKSEEWLLIKPLLYVNKSGEPVREVLNYYQLYSTELNNLYIIFDDLDMEVGNNKLQFAVGPKVHNGLGSLYQYLKTDQFWHARIGIDGRSGDRSIPGEQYVLAPFSEAEKKEIDSQIADSIEKIINN